jgi:hypothetical protein
VEFRNLGPLQPQSFLQPLPVGHFVLYLSDHLGLFLFIDLIEDGGSGLLAVGGFAVPALGVAARP